MVALGNSWYWKQSLKYLKFQTSQDTSFKKKHIKKTKNLSYKELSPVQLHTMFFPSCDKTFKITVALYIGHMCRGPWVTRVKNCSFHTLRHHIQHETDVMYTRLPILNRMYNIDSMYKFQFIASGCLFEACRKAVSLMATVRLLIRW